MQKEKRRASDRDEPELTEGSLVFYRDLLSEQLCSTKKQQRVMETPVRFVSKDGHVYGARFIGKLLDLCAEHGIVARAWLEDMSWSPTFGDLIGYITDLLKRWNTQQVAA